MSILIKNKPNYFKEIMEDIIYDLAFNQQDYELINEHISYKGDTLYLNIPPHKILEVEILYLTNIISPNFNRFQEKEFNKLVISYNKTLELSTYVSTVARRDPKRVIFEDGFMIESDNGLKIR